MDSATSTFNSVPQGVRRHIAIFGRRNVGKSSLLNALAGQQVAIVADEPGTTTDPVNRAIELHPLGPCLLIDTAGFDDVGSIGTLRNERTKRVLEQADMALLVTDGTNDLQHERQWMALLNERSIPTVVVMNKVDVLPPTLTQTLGEALGTDVVAVSALTGQGLDLLRNAMARLVTDDVPHSITGALARPADTVVLVMPQNAQAPQGRLILPQVQTIRDLLDKDCTIVSCTTQGLSRSLQALREPPALIITDSQAFAQVKPLTPPATRLTSFSMLMAAVKGDPEVLAQGARAIDSLTPQSHVLIAEACTHVPMSEDIGRVQLPRLIRQRVGEGVQFTVVSGRDFPTHLQDYDLIIHCGACMFNRRAMLSRIEAARRCQVPITNYGMAMAHLHQVFM